MTGIPSPSLGCMLVERSLSQPTVTALMHKNEGQWHRLSWKNVAGEVCAIAGGLKKRGVGAGDRVAILSQSRFEWTLVDWAVLSLGAVTVSLYPTYSAEDVFEILSSCQAKVVFVENRSQLAKLQVVAHQIKLPISIVCFDFKHEEAGVLSLDALKSESIPEWSEATWASAAQAVVDTELATIIYTSGTSGHPRGIKLSHKNLAWLLTKWQGILNIGDEDLSLFVLPQAHILGRLDSLLPLVVGNGCAYGRGYLSLKDDLLETRPTFLVGVPRIFEDLQKEILEQFEKENWFKRQALARSFASARRSLETTQRAGVVGPLTKLEGTIADRFFFDGIRARFGRRLRFCVSGGAALRRDTSEFFFALGIPLLEGYGLTETSGLVFLNSLENYRLGSTGQALPGVDFKIANDGELLLKSPSVAQDSLKSGEWFATGDTAEIDPKGFLTITGRKKELLVLNSGKSISPVKIESKLRAHALFDHVVVAGEARSFLVALLSLNRSAASRLARAKSIHYTTYEDLLSHPEFNRAVGEIVDTMNRGVAPFEMLRRFAILKRDLSVDAGELSSTLKVKRAFCIKKYTKLIDRLYDSAT
jgi:long-chain acyl-CoA synthetase